MIKECTVDERTPTPGKRLLKISAVLFGILGFACLIFAVLGLFGIGMTDTFYLESAIAEAASIYANIDGEPVWTAESWESLQTQLQAARTLLSDASSTQEQIDFAVTSLRNAIASLKTLDEFAQEDVGAFIPSGRTMPIYFTSVIIFAVFLLISGYLAYRFSSAIKKGRMLGIFGMLNLVFTGFMIVFTVNVFGPAFFTVLLAALIVPVVYLAGAHRNDRRVSTVITFGVLCLLSLIVLFPLYWIIRSSLMILPEVATMNIVPSRWMFSNYPRALEAFRYFLYLRNTFIIAVPAVVLGTSTAILCAYSFARLRFRGKKFMFGLCIASMLLPPMVTMIPLFIVFTSFFNMSNSFWPLIIPWVCGGGALDRKSVV